MRKCIVLIAGGLFLGMLLLVGCGDDKPTSKYVLEEVIDVHGNCSENHVGQNDSYTGTIVRWRTKETGEVNTYGSVTRTGDLVQRVLDETTHPTAYHTPFMVTFDKISIDTNQPKWVLHGVSDGTKGARSYDTTCEVEVVKRGTELAK